MSEKSMPRVADNDRDEITVVCGERLLRSYVYDDEAERRIKIGKAREFVEGWYAASAEAGHLYDVLVGINDRHIPDQPAAYGGSEYDWVVRQYAELRRIALAALSRSRGE